MLKAVLSFFKQRNCRHKEWKDIDQIMVDSVPATLQECTNCGFRKYLVKAMWEHDLKAMVDKGKISEAAYLKCVTQGFIDKKSLEITNEEYIHETLFN